MAEEVIKNPKEIIEKLQAYFKPKRNVIYERYTFFFHDQEANETFDAYLVSLRRLASSCESLIHNCVGYKRWWYTSKHVKRIITDTRSSSDDMSKQ